MASLVAHQQDYRFLSNFLKVLSAFLVGKRKTSDKSNKAHKWKSIYDLVVITVQLFAMSVRKNWSITW